jgi:deoxyribodipyrimidine photo-lyase
MLLENGLFIFRRDFRIIDNHGLNYINQKCKNVYTIFIFTPEQVGSGNQYKSNNSVQFMIESLESLASQISKNGGKLICFYGPNKKVVSECIKSFKIDCVCFNSDYTPYALERDHEIMELCKKMQIVCDKIPDYYLHEPGTVMSGSKSPYKKFTPYYNVAIRKKVDLPERAHKIYFRSSSSHLPNMISLQEAFHKFVSKENPNILVHGGREDAVKTLKTALVTQKHYSSTHNDLDKPTTRLSAYLKFGCISIREAYKALKGKHDLIRQLIWRDFYMNILYFFPYVLGKPMKPSYSKIKWHNNHKWFEDWTKGETGYPVVDAAMTELNITGFMHNRARLIVASFLTKTLLIDWREGEKYFAKKLTDYDPASNNGNWQWVASSGADSQPYFRIFNPWLQGEEYDSDAKYIKKWLPQLNDVPAKDIHNWYKVCNLDKYKKINYPDPICDYDEQKKKALAMFRAIY